MEFYLNWVVLECSVYMQIERSQNIACFFINRLEPTSLLYKIYGLFRLYWFHNPLCFCFPFAIIPGGQEQYFACINDYERGGTFLIRWSRSWCNGYQRKPHLFSSGQDGSSPDRDISSEPWSRPQVTLSLGDLYNYMYNWPLSYKYVMVFI